MFGFGVFDYLKITIGAFVGIGLAFVPIYYYGKHIGRQAAAIESLETSVEVLRQRGEIRNEISNADIDKLCTFIGLSDADKDECVRRLRETNPDR